MTVPNSDIYTRVNELESSLRSEMQFLRDHARTLATRLPHRDTRLAITSISPGESEYPSTGNTFYLEFVDAYFSPLAAGSSTITHSSREGTTKGDGAFARNIADKFVGEGTFVLATWQRATNNSDPAARGEWWFQRLTSASTEKVYLCRFQLTGTLGYGAHETAAATVLECSDDTIADIGASITVEDHTATGFRGWSGYEGIAYAYQDDLDAGCNWTVIFLEEKAEIAVWNLTSGFTGGAGGTTLGTLVEYWQGRSPTGSETLEDPCGIYEHLSGGDCVVTSYDDSEDRYKVIDAVTRINIAEVCARHTGFEAVTNYTKVASVSRMKSLEANKDSWLSLHEKTAQNGTALITLEPCWYDHTVLQTTSGKVRYTQHLRIAKTMETGADGVGSGSGPSGTGDGWAWWKQTSPPVPPANGTEFWLGQGGDRDQKWLVPFDEAWNIGVANVLYIKQSGKNRSPDYDADCFQLGWTEPGVGDGVNGTVQSTITLLDDQYEPVDLTFHAGVLVKAAYNVAASQIGDILEVMTDEGDAWCKDETWPVVDPCYGPHNQP